MSATEYEEVLRPSKIKWVLMLLICLVFVAVGIYVGVDAKATEDRLLSYACIGFFGLGIVISIVQFVPDSSYLRITAEGLTVRTLWRTKLYRWSDIEGFGVIQTPGPNRMIGINFSRTWPGRKKSETMRSMSRGLTGFDGALPDNYGWDYAELAEHLNALKSRFLDAAGKT